jgi:hypothetical protein
MSLQGCWFGSVCVEKYTLSGLCWRIVEKYLFLVGWHGGQGGDEYELVLGNTL